MVARVSGSPGHRALVLGASVLAIVGIARADSPARLPGQCKDFRETGRTKLSGSWGSFAFREHGSVQAFALLPDGKRVVTAADDGTLALWDLVTGDRIWSFDTQRKFLFRVAVSPGGTRALTGSGLGDLTLWDLDHQDELWTTCAHGQVWDLAFAPDGLRALSAGSEGAVCLWDVETGRCIRTFEGHADQIVRALAFTADGKRAMSASAGSTKLWDLATGGERDLELGGAWTLAALPDGKRALLGWQDGYRVFNLDAQDDAEVLLGKGSFLALSPDGKRVLLREADSYVALQDLATQTTIMTFGLAERAWPYRAAFTPDGRRAVFLTVVSRGENVKKGHVAVFDLEARKELHLEGHRATVSDLVVTPDGKTAVSVSLDHTLRLWDAANGRELATLTSQTAASALVLSRNGRTLLAGREPWDIRTRTADVPIYWMNESRPGVAFVGSETRFLKWDTGAPFVGELAERDVEPVRSVGAEGVEIAAVSADQTRMFARCHDGRFVVSELVPPDFLDFSWRTIGRDQEPKEIGQDVAKLPNRVRLAPSPDGRRLLVASTLALTLYDAERKGVIWKNEDLDSCSRVAVSPDGKIAAVGDWRSGVVLVSLDSGKELDRLELEEATRGIPALAFSPDGKRLLVGTTLGPILVFDMKKRQ